MADPDGLWSYGDEELERCEHCESPIYEDEKCNCDGADCARLREQLVTAAEDFDSIARFTNTQLRSGRKIANYAVEAAMRCRNGALLNTPVRPKIVCLCGSTRFYKAFMQANYNETMAGRIVLSIGFYMHASEEAHGETIGCTPEQKVKLDELYLRKIDLADEILVINVNGYIGEGTANEIAYTKRRGKPIRWLETPTQEKSDG